MLTILATILIGGLFPILLVTAAFVVTSMGNRCASATVVLVALSVAGCEVAPDDVVSIEATGAVEGMAWVDENGTGALDGLDRPVQGVRVELRAPTGPEALYTATTDNNGDFLIPGVVVGDYRVAVDSASVGDTLHVLPVDNPDVTIGADETATVFVGLTYPWATTDSIRVTVPGRRLFVEGRVIAVWNTYGEGMLHIRDRAGGLAAVRVQANSLALGDSARLLGVADRQGGRTVLRDATVVLINSGIEPPGPVAVSTGMAATADSGRLDAELGRVGSALIQDTLRNTFGERVLRVDDGSGVLDVVLDRDIPFVINLSSGTVIGAPIDATGILTPPVSGTEGVWVLKPRRDSDLTVLVPNGTPTASFTYACTGLDCDFDGTDSSDPDGDALSYAWDFGDGATASGATWSHTYAAAGTYAVTVTVSDGRLTDTDTRDVTVTEGNAAPTASFTFSCEGLDCDFDGTDSSDPDGDALSYAWDFGDGATASGATTSHTYDDGGTYAVTLTVSDGSLTDTDTRDVTVTEGNAAPTASFTFSCEGLDCDFDGTDSSDPDGDDDDDDDDLSYDWDFGDGATASGATTSHTYDDGGTYAVTLTVSDGSLSDTDTRDVTVTAISLTVTGYKVRALQKADLAWSGATSDDVDIFRDGALLITTDNDGAYTDDIDGDKKKKSYTYQVCEAGTDICSYEEIVTFD